MHANINDAAALEERGARATLMTPREHDEAMTVILGLAHFIAIVSADSLLARRNFQRMKDVGGTTFKVLYTLVESVISEDPELYASLQMGFPGIDEIEEDFMKRVETWAGLVKHRDRPAFVERMNSLKTALEETDPSFEKAYEKMYRLTEDL